MESQEFEWDDVKAASNPRKHGVDFADAIRFSVMLLLTTVSRSTPYMANSG
jgi:uncharacterized DUF497 family protein